MVWNLWLPQWEFSLLQHLCLLLYSFLSLRFPPFSPPLCAFFTLVIPHCLWPWHITHRVKGMDKGSVFLSPAQQALLRPPPAPQGPDWQRARMTPRAPRRDLLTADWGRGDWFGTLLSKAIKYLISWSWFVFQLQSSKQRNTSWTPNVHWWVSIVLPDECHVLPWVPGTDPLNANIDLSMEVASFTVPKGTFVWRSKEEALKPVFLGVHVIGPCWVSGWVEGPCLNPRPLLVRWYLSFHTFYQNCKITERQVQHQKPESQVFTIERGPGLPKLLLCHPPYEENTRKSFSRTPGRRESKEGPGKKIWGLRPLSSMPQKTTYAMHGNVAPGLTWTWEPVSGRQNQTDLCHRCSLGPRSSHCYFQSPAMGRIYWICLFPATHSFAIPPLLPAQVLRTPKGLQYACSNPLPSSHQHSACPHSLEHDTLGHFLLSVRHICWFSIRVYTG